MCDDFQSSTVISLLGRNGLLQTSLATASETESGVITLILSVYPFKLVRLVHSLQSIIV